MDQAAANDQLIDIKIQLNAGDFYRISLRSFARPVAAFLLVPIAITTYYTFQSGGSFGSVVIFIALLFLFMPALTIFAAHKRNMLKKPIRYVFSNSGISTITVSASGFMDWSWVKSATESRKYIWVRLQDSFTVVPKGQLTSGEIASVRALLVKHLGSKARLAASPV